jgi:TatD DNase family protein
MWVDTHCHLQLDARPADELIDRAADVEWLVVPGVDARTSQAAAELADRYPGRLEWTAGLHPHDAERWPGEEAEITRLAARAAAVGECGLDYYRNLSDPEAQRAAFIAQIELADALGKPVVVHCRDAFADVHDILERTGYGPRTVLHCWTGGRRWTRRFLDLGVVFSFAGPLTYPTGETIRLAAELVPPDRAMVETDTPYLSPEPHRGEPNEPAWIAHTGEVLASVWAIGVEEAARLTTATAERVFRT